jgi:hypothetical protein
LSTQAGGPVLDLRTYRLVPGAGERFDRIVRERALPMLERFRIDVVGHGPSLDDPDLYYLARAFASAARCSEELDAFYWSDEWRRRHRDEALALIESYHALVIPAAPALRDSLP